jgi:hypothetical protein
MTFMNEFSSGDKNEQSCTFSKGPVTLLRMRETYEKRMKINEIILIRTKIL